MAKKNAAAKVALPDGISIIDVTMPVADLQPYERNARKHPQSQIDELVQRFITFGFTNPLIVDENRLLLAGHGRLEAAKQAGMTAVPCRQVYGLSEERKRAYVIWDNKSALDAQWDQGMLVAELKDLEEAGVLDLTGFDSGEIDLLENGWQSDMERVAAAGENLDGVATVLRIQVESGEDQKAREAITLALDAAGITYAFK